MRGKNILYFTLWVKDENSGCGVIAKKNGLINKPIIAS